MNKSKRKFADVLVDAILMNDLPKLESLLEDGYDPNETDEHGVTALMVAAGRGRLNAVKLLLKNGADVNVQDHSGLWPLGGRTALMFAASGGNLEVVKELWESGANLDAQDADGETALMKAAFNGCFEIVELLLLAGAEVSIKNDDGETVLAKTESIGQTKIAELLNSKQ